MSVQGRDDEEAALTLGASGWRMFLTVTLPKQEQTKPRKPAWAARLPDGAATTRTPISPGKPAAETSPRPMMFFTFAPSHRVIGVGAWLGTIMLFNVWVFIWPNQKKILGIVAASDEVKAAARKTAGLASRINFVLSVPMLMCMGGQSHGLPF